MDAVSFVTASVSMRLHLSFTRRRFEFVIKTGSFWKRFQKWSVFSGAFSKRYSFIGCISGETASIRKRSGAKLADSRSVVFDPVSRSWNRYDWKPYCVNATYDLFFGIRYSKYDQLWAFKCSACGFTIFLVFSIKFSYCLKKIRKLHYMSSSVSGPDEPNPALWLATRAVKMELSCPLGYPPCPARKMPLKAIK